MCKTVINAGISLFIIIPATDCTKVVGTPNFIKDVGTCASRLIDSASVSALPVDPTDLFYNKHAPFYNTTVNPKTTFDIVGLGAWCSQEDHELISMEQPRQTSSDQLRPAVTSGGQPEPNCDPFWTSSDQLQPATLRPATTSQSQTVTLFGPL